MVYPCMAEHLGLKWIFGFENFSCSIAHLPDKLGLVTKFSLNMWSGKILALSNHICADLKCTFQYILMYI